MLKLLAAALLLAASLAPLTNDDVVKLSKAGLSAETIIAKICTSETKFATDTDSLVALAKDGVADAVIRAMVERRASARRPEAKPASGGLKPAAPLKRKRIDDVTVATAAGGKCEHAILEISASGIKTTGCHETDVNVEWKNVTAVRYLYSFRSTLVLTTTTGERRIYTTTPAELKAVAEAVHAYAPMK
ncbi:MAG TPA: hypothetical protein VM733_14960 [Thermoanaerobaculia bacterium]|nr:hypothetical protein [Thermoanaerobaculia bacterium]